MVVTYATEASISVMNASFPLYHLPPKETLESLDHSELRNKQSAKCKAKLNTALSNALQAKHGNVPSLAGAVYDKSCTDSESQIGEKVRRKQDAIAQLEKKWREEVATSAQYHAYKKAFIEMLSQFNPCEMATLDPSTLQSTALSCFNQKKHQYPLHYTEQAIKLENLRSPRSKKYLRKISSNQRKQSGQHPLNS